MLGLVSVTYAQKECWLFLYFDSIQDESVIYKRKKIILLNKNKTHCPWLILYMLQLSVLCIHSELII